MTVRELIEKLATYDPEARVHVYDEDAPAGSTPVTGTDNYESVIVLVTNAKE